ncbi:WD40-repeat-containing domain protein [Gloeopeniophorella convolvens]|nr:WD40-repeat-containing domain protein [Gloeopeniophorella convolvens]
MVTRRSHIASGSGDHTVIVWDAATGEKDAGPFVGHTGQVNTVAFSPGGHRIASGSDDGTVRVWNSTTGALVTGPLHGHMGRVLSAAFSPDGQEVVSSSSDKTIRIWDVSAPSEDGKRRVWTPRGHWGRHPECGAVAITPDGRRAVSGVPFEGIHVWDTATGAIVSCVSTGITYRIMSVAISPDGQSVASCTDQDTSLRLWDATTGAEAAVPKHGKRGFLLSTVFSPDGKHVAAGDIRGYVFISSLATGETIAEMSISSRIAEGEVIGRRGIGNGVDSVVFSPNGQLLAVGADDGKVYIWDFASGETRTSSHSQKQLGIFSIAFSPDGETFASGSDDGTVRLWNTATGLEATPVHLIKQTGRVKAIAFSPSGRHLAAGWSKTRAPGAITVWNVATGEVVAGPFYGHAEDVRAVRFLPDGKTIASISTDPSARLWRLAIKDAEATEPPKGGASSAPTPTHPPELAPGQAAFADQDQAAICDPCEEIARHSADPYRMATMSPNSGILVLPDELITKILECTDYKTVVSARQEPSLMIAVATHRHQLCHRLKEVIDASSALQYTIELAAAGIHDGAPSTTGPAERLAKLRSLRTAWRDSAWSAGDAFPQLRRLYPFPLTVSGNLIVFQTHPIRTAETEAGTKSRLLMQRMPSPLRGIPERHWFVELDCPRMQSVRVDDSQDLLVVLSLPKIFIRTISTAEVHPLTQTPGGAINSWVDYQRFADFALHVHEDRVALVSNIANPNKYIFIWNWKTGLLVAHIQHEDKATSCAFLDSTHFAFATPVSHAADAPDPIQLHVVVLPDPATERTTERPPAYRRYAFSLAPPALLPLPAPGVPRATHSLFLCPNALPSALPATPGLFHPARAASMLVLEVEALPHGPAPPAFPLHVVAVPHAALLAHAVPGEPVHAREPVRVPWAQWGPARTRVATLPHASAGRYPGLGRACGMLALGEPAVDAARRVVRLMDFHPQRVARATKEPSPPPPPPLPRVPLRRGTRGRAPAAFERVVAGRVGAEAPEDAEAPYVLREIPLPDELQSANVIPVVCEDVVVLIEYTLGTWGDIGHRIDRVFSHPI